MKARTLVLMLLGCLLSFTGFGNTTPDLSQNSDDHEIILSDTMINVVAVEKVITITDAHDNRFVPILKEADAAFNKEFKEDLDRLKPDKKNLKKIIPGPSIACSNRNDLL